MKIGRVLLVSAGCLVLPSVASAQDAAVDVAPFIAAVDVNKDGTMARDEWKQAGLMDVAFGLCDRDGNDRITTQEMSVCAIPESMDPKKEGVLTVYARGRFVIASPGAPVPKPQNAPPGITQATQMLSDSPYVEGGPTGADFIKLFDTDGDGKVSHAEWEKAKNATVFKPYRWPQYNRNRDEWITVDEAPRKPTK